MLYLIAILAFAAILIWYFFVRPLNFWTKQGVKQSKPWIFFGDTGKAFFAKGSFPEFINAIYKQHPGERYSGAYNFSHPVLVLKDPELIKQVIVKDFEHFTDHPQVIDPEADPLWSNSVVALKGERWKEMRNTLTPTFTSAKIKTVYLLILETAENFVKHFLEKEDDVIEFDMKDAYSRFANDVIATTAFGVQVDSLKEPKNNFYTMGKQLISFKGLLTMVKLLGQTVFPKLFKGLGMTFFDKVAAKYFYGLIDDNIRIREEQKIFRQDLIQIMLEARKEDNTQISEPITGKSKAAIKISNSEITSQAMIFFFAGFDTVSTTMTFASYELALNKEVQDRLRKEINETQKDGKITYDQLMKMKYMDMVVSETLRKRPPFIYTDRICTKPYTIEPVSKDEKPVHLSVNQELWIPVYGIQRDPKYFPDPDTFDPERFSDENKNNIIPSTYLPFGTGPRACIGNRFALVEIKALLFNLLLHFELVPTKKTAIPLILSKDFTLIPEQGIWLGLKRIKSS